MQGAASGQRKAVRKQRARAQAQAEDCIYDADNSDSAEVVTRNNIEDTLCTASRASEQQVGVGCGQAEQHVCFQDDATELFGDEGSGLGGPPEAANRLSGVQLCHLRPVLLPPVADKDNSCSVCGDEDGSDSE